MASTLKSQRGKAGGGIGPEETLVAGALKRTSGRSGASSYEPGDYVTAFYPTGEAKDGFWSEDVSPPMKVGSGVGAPAGIGIAHTLQANERNNSDPTSEAKMHVYQDALVRRLTPRECERLQGLADDWTDVDGAADSPRYAALGDAVTATVSAWIGSRIAKAANSQGRPE